MITVRTWGGIGDVLLLTPSLRAIKQANPNERLKVSCRKSSDYQVLLHNPHIDVLTMVPTRRRAKAMALARRLLKIEPSERVGEYGRLHPSLMPDKHATEIIADMLGVTLVDRTIEVCLTNAEETEAKEILSPYSNVVIMHITSRCSSDQNWQLHKWAELVSLHPAYTFVQIGQPDEGKVEGAIDMRGRTSLRLSIAMLKQAKAFVGVVSSMSHATNAVSTPGVVLFGASSPEVWAHPNNVTISRRLRCSPCIEYILSAPCPYGAPCMSEITVEEVGTALMKQMKVSRTTA